MQGRRVVITGMGALTPIGLGLAGYEQGLRQGISGAAPITHFDAAAFKTQFACELKNFQVGDYIDRKEARRMDPFAHYGIAVANEAIEDAALQFDALDRDRIGVIMGSGIGGLKTFQEEVTKYAQQSEASPRFNPFFIPKMIIDILSGHISIRHGLRGPNYATVSACATSTNCLIDAALIVQAGMADVMIAGGAEAAITESGVGGFSSMKALSQRNDDPATASRPFDQERDGFVLGEGGGALVVEDYEHARQRGAKIYAELAGAGMSADAYHLTAPEPEGHGARLVMHNALQSAGVAPEAIDYLNMHGTSTPLGDVAETKAIKQLFGEHAYQLSISSTKSMTGHLLGAAGAIEAIACVLAVHKGFIPPTINHFTDDPDCDLDYTFNQAREQPVTTALSNTFGFGGHNASVIFRQMD